MVSHLDHFELASKIISNLQVIRNDRSNLAPTNLQLVACVQHHCGRIILYLKFTRGRVLLGQGLIQVIERVLSVEAARKDQVHPFSILPRS